MQLLHLPEECGILLLWCSYSFPIFLFLIEALLYGFRLCGMMNTMSILEQQMKAQTFIERWKGHGAEKQETWRFWVDLLENVLGLSHVTDLAKPEYPTSLGGYIDLLFPDSRFLVEQKSASINLDKPEERQGTMVTPVQQALRYADSLPLSMKPAVICTCNFNTFRFYDLEKDPRATGEPADEFALEDLAEHLGTLTSIFNEEHSRMRVEEKLSERAGLLVANLHNALAAQYDDPDEAQSHHSLAVLTVRIVFCLYAEDAGLFGSNAFSNYVENNDVQHLRRAIVDLFHVLNTPKAQRDKYLEDELKNFDYVNGGLFAEPIEIPPFTEEIRDAMLKAGEGFNWRKISPVIFGSLMEETLSHDQRRQGGMHYTTVKNIHRVIDPLFLDGLKAELKAIEKDESIGERARLNQLQNYQNKLASLKFLDPACGSGNFLTETFLQLRALENQALSDMLHGQGYLELGGKDSFVKVSIDQFHGIEINDFAVAVAKTALWIAEQQALDDTEIIASQALPHLPLHDSGNIVQGNELLPASECNYVMGNPPFVGQYLKAADQKTDLQELMGKDYDGYLDYSTGWYYKAAHYVNDVRGARFAFVSTNSITQGQPVPALFKPLFAMGWKIAFAHRSFAWDAQSTDVAHVYVVIIGMSKGKVSPVVFEYEDVKGEPVAKPAHNINGYLIDAPNIFVEKRMLPLSTLTEAKFGSKPVDGGHLIINSQEEYEEAMADPIAAKYVRPFRGSRELINHLDRWCLWMQDATPSEMLHSRFISQRVAAVREFRLASKKKPTREKANSAWLFDENHQPVTSYLAIPKVFSARREYATCDWFESDVISSDLNYTCVDPDGFAFAIVESSMFITWQKAIGGRLGNGCRFSNTVVWNNLPLPAVSEELRGKVIVAGKAVLEARANHPESSLAELYNPAFMPVDLRKAHQELDKVVDRAFGAAKSCRTNDERLKILFNNYAKMTK